MPSPWKAAVYRCVVCFGLVLTAVLFVACSQDQLDALDDAGVLNLPDGGSDVLVADNDGDLVDVGSEPDVPDSPGPNDGWIGGSCDGFADCDYEGAVCLEGSDGFPGGTCSQACDRFCPDRDDHSVTFCIDAGSTGMCVQRCDTERFSGDGCRVGYECRVLPRYNEPSVQQASCVPSDWERPDATSSCLQQLDELGVSWSHWDYDTETASNGDVCGIDDPIVVAPTINGVTYRYYSNNNPSSLRMACDLAVALHELGELLGQYDITDVLHIGTFSCRTIGTSDRLSYHSFGLAIDIYGFEDTSGDDYILERDWIHDTTSFPAGSKAEVLYEIARAMYDQRIFNTILTPNYDRHDNHYHVDLTPGAHFIGHGASPYYFGDSAEMWDRCGHGH